MKTQTKMVSQKLTSNMRAMEIAKKGLASANRKNPFWNKSDAMKTINFLNKENRKLAKEWQTLDFSV